MTKGLFSKKILPFALSAAMVLSTGFTTYADDGTDPQSGSAETAAESTETTQETIPEESETGEETPIDDPANSAEAGNEDTDTATAASSAVSEADSSETEEDAAQQEEPEEPVLYNIHIDSNIEHGIVKMAEAGELQTEDLQKQENTIIYVSLEAGDGYAFSEVKILDETGTEVESVPVTENSSYLENLDEKTDALYRFTVPASDVTIQAAFAELPKEEKDTEETGNKSEPDQETVQETEDSVMLASDGETKTESVALAMIGFQSYEAAGYGTGFDAAFALADGSYDGNGNAFCLNPAVQAPGRDSMNTTITYTTTTTAYTDPVLLKILYYGFGGEGDISTRIASDAPSRHILTHMALVRRAAELGIDGAGDYTYGANSTAIALADQLYDLCASQPTVSGSAKVLTPVSGMQTIVLIAEVLRKGTLTLTKTSADASMTEGNDCYSLEGAGYVVYSDSACTQSVGTFTTNSDGHASVSMSLDPGTYYVKEVTAPSGYALDTKVYTATVTKGSTTDVSVSDQPLNDPTTLLVEKVDAKTGKATERLAGAEFTINYYTGTSASGSPAKTWILKTDTTGRVRLDAEHLVSGDDFFYDASTGAPVLPLGVITIQETKAPEGYLLNDTMYTCPTTEAGNVVTTGNLPVGENAVKEQRVAPELKTTAISKTTGTHSAAVNENETVEDTVSCTKLAPDTAYTVKGKLVDKETEKVLAEGSTDFTAESTEQKVKVSLGIDTTDLEGKSLVVFEDLYEEGSDEPVAVHEEIADDDQTVNVVKLRTHASDGQTGTNEGVSGKTTISDNVSYTNLTIGKSYTVKGTLYDQETGEALTIDGATSETTFTADQADGKVALIYTIDASVLAGKSIVVFEDLYYKGIKIASHADLTDKPQTVSYPSISTTAKDGNTDSNVGIPVQTTIIDTVDYTNLTPGKEYTMKGTLMDQAANAELSIDGAENETTFTPDSASGSVDVEFTIDASVLEGTSVVVFEKLFLNGVEVASHADITDQGQTVTYTKPEIKTTAKDGQSGTHSGTIGQTTIVDTVKYTGLVSGKEYKISGVVMNEETGEELLVDGAAVTAEKTFTAEDAKGSVDLTFTLDASALEGKTVVVFEDLYYNGIQIAVHADLSDEDQSIHYPKIRTTASVNGSKEVTVSANTTLTDTVSYTNMIAGETYTVKGTLMDKDTGKELLINGSTVTSEASFTPESSDGTADVVFTFDSSSLGGKTTVVFEKLFCSGTEIARHEDINDSDQSVVLKSKPSGKPTPGTGSAPDTGDPTNNLPYACASAAALLGLACLAFIRRRSR